MQEPNPYHATQTFHATSAFMPHGMVRSWSNLLWWTVFSQPLVILAAMHGSWLLTAITNGHLPNFGDRPIGDLPNLIGGALGGVAAICMLAGPTVTPAMMVWCVMRPFGWPPRATPKLATRFYCLGLYCLVWLLAITYLYNDPFQVFYWFID